MKCRYLNIGGRDFHQPRWLNLDYDFQTIKYKKELIDINHNLMSMKPFPLDDEHFDAVYTEHCIEHLTEKAAHYTIQESYRILKKGGVFRVSCPDAEKILNNYIAGNYDLVSKGKSVRTRTPEFNLVDMIYSSMNNIYTDEKIKEMAINGTLLESFEIKDVSEEDQLKKAGRHISWWTVRKMMNELISVGFINVKESGPQESRLEELRSEYIDRTAPFLSLYVEGVKGVMPYA